MMAGRWVNVWIWPQNACTQVRRSVALRPPVFSRSRHSCKSPCFGWTVLTNRLATLIASWDRLGVACGVTYQYAPRTSPAFFAFAQLVAKFVSTEEAVAVP